MQPPKPTKKTAITLPGAILKGEFLLLFNLAFKVRKSGGMRAYWNSKKRIYTSGFSCPGQSSVFLTGGLCLAVGPSRNWMKTNILRVERSMK